MKIVIEDGRQNFYQWDKDQRVKLEGVTLNHYVHFGRPDGGAYEVKIYKDGSWFYANVPNIWLQLSGIQKLYIVNGDKQTEHRASLFITPREKPDGYLYTETEILSFVSLDERLRRLEGDPSVGGYATEQYVNDYAQPKGDYLESSALPAAIDTALAQAKESGEFDGPQGKPGKDYVLTPEDKKEIAEMAADLVEVPDSGGNVDQSQIEQAVADYMEENPVEATVADGSITEEKLSDEVKASIEKAAKSGGGSAEYKWIPRGLMRDQIKTFQGWTHCVRYDERLEKAVGIVMAGEAAHTNEQPWYRVTIDGNGYMSDYEEIIIYDTDGSTVYKPNNGYVCGFCILSDGTYLIQDNDWNTDDTPNFYKSTDYGKTFTRLDIEGFPSQAFGLRQLSTGRVISGSAGARNRFYYSDDFGMTWHESNVLDTSVLGRPPFEADPAYEFAEHCIVEFQNGTLLAIGRTSNNARDQYGEIRGDLQGAAIAYSDDHGETWRDFGRSKTITNMTANNAACVYINGIYHLVVGDRYTYTTDKEGNRRYFAMYYQYATEEDALNDNWSEPVAIDYGHWHSDATAHPTDCGYPSLWKDKNDNLHCVFYDADGSGHPYGANWRLIDGNPYIQTNFVSDEHSESHCIAYSQAEVTRMLNEQRTYITNLMMGYVNDIYEKLNALPPDSDQNDGVNYITSNLLLDFNYVDASLYAADASYVKANYFANGDAYAFYPNGDTLFEVWDKFPAITHGQNGAFIWSADSDVTSKNSMSLTDIGIDSDEGFTLEFGGCVGNSYSNNLAFIGTYKYSLGGQATSWEKFYTVVSIADGKLKQMEVPFTGTLTAYGLLHAVCVYTPSAITVYYNGSAIGSVELDTEQYALLKGMTVTATNGNAAAKTINRVYNAPLTADQCMNNYKWFKNFVDNYGTESTE